MTLLRYHRMWPAKCDLLPRMNTSIYILSFTFRGLVRLKNAHAVHVATCAPDADPYPPNVHQDKISGQDEQCVQKKTPSSKTLSKTIDCILHNGDPHTHGHPDHQGRPANPSTAQSHVRVHLTCCCWSSFSPPPPPVRATRSDARSEMTPDLAYECE